MASRDLETWDKLARQRIRLCYFWKFGRLPRLDAPRRFTEWVQWSKLHDRDPRMVERLDKLASKRLAEERLGRDWIVPTLWSGEVLPEIDPFSGPVIVKARHGCNQFQIMRKAPTAAEWTALRKRSGKWCTGPYGLWLDEWAYRDVPRGLLAERLLHGKGPLPIDYKILTFQGQATHIQIHVNREHGHRKILFDLQGKALCGETDVPAMPRSLHAMIGAAEALADDFPFARIDFYEVDGYPLFGEFAFYHGSGLRPIGDDVVDFELGAMWREARLGSVTREPEPRRIGQGSQPDFAIQGGHSLNQ